MAALAGTQCGYPDFMFGSAATMGGSGGGGGGGTTSSTSGVSGDSGPKSCRLLHDTEDCGAGKRCTIDDMDKGTTRCADIAGSPLGPFDACVGDTRCPAGTWCDHRTSTCAPFCDSGSACGKGNCVPARSDVGKTVPGASVCTSHCDPISAIPCGKGATCTYSKNMGEFDCVLSLGYVEGAKCMYLDDCGKGLVCVSTGCTKWCYPAGSTSDPGCQNGCGTFTDLTPVFEGETYGFCY